MKTFVNVNLAIACLVVGCGTASAPKPPEASRNSGDASASLAEKVTPPAGYYEVAMSFQLDRVFGEVAESSEVQTIYVNLDGGTVKKGFALGQSFLVCADSAVVPAKDLSNDDKDDLVYYVTKYIEAQYPNTKVVFEKPSDPNVSMVMVTDNADVLGCGPAGIKFTAPLDEGNLHPADIAFVFAAQTDNSDDLITQVQTAIETMMGVSSPPTKLALADDVTGEKEINSLSRLLWELDDSKILNIQALTPELEKLIPGGMRYIDSLNKIVTVTVGLGEQQATGSTTKPATTGSTAKGGLFSWIASILGGGISAPPSGSTTTPSTTSGLLSSIAVLTGHPEIAMAAKLLGSRIGTSTGAITLTGNEPQTLMPNYASLIGLTGIASVPDLVENMKAHAAFVAKNYDNQTKSSLDAMLVVAYSQAFRGIVKSSTSTASP